MRHFSEDESMPHAIAGKLVIAPTQGEVARLCKLANRARWNGLTSEILISDQIAAVEPSARGMRARISTAQESSIQGRHSAPC